MPGSVNLVKRIVKLEESVTLALENRLVLRFVDSGSEGTTQTTNDEIDNGVEIFTVCFVAAEDGRPA
jgi:hypothetical protein